MPFRFYDINWTFHALFMTFFAVSTVLFFYLSYKRRRDFEFVAARLGLRLVAEPADLVRPLLDAFDFFVEKNPDCVAQVITGTVQGMPLTAFNYNRREGPTFAELHLSQCVVFDMSGPLPDFWMNPAPEKPDVLVTDGIFWEDASFSSYYAVRGTDAAFAHRLFDAEQVAWFADHPGFIIHTAGSRLLIARAGEYETRTFRAFLEDALPLAQHAYRLTAPARSSLIKTPGESSHGT